MACAAAVCGADAVMVEVHGHPDKALCDGDQSETPDMFYRMVKDLQVITGAIGRTL
jgi:3-deoxy-7-phosphoheptulonate synthase